MGFWLGLLTFIGILVMPILTLSIVLFSYGHNFLGFIALVWQVLAWLFSD